jgi:hypothetical protein
MIKFIFLEIKLTKEEMIMKYFKLLDEQVVPIQ